MTSSSERHATNGEGARTLRPLADPTPNPAPPGPAGRLRRALFGAPRRLDDRRLFHRVSLIAPLAWVGLGADGLSSSAYGPEEAFRALGSHTWLALPLALLMATTVFVIAAAYSRIIEAFPHGGGGYSVASRLLGERVGLVSGGALLVDYVLTITISIAAAGDALFSLWFIPHAWQAFKLPLEATLILSLLLLNLRGVRESVIVLAPIFALFLLTHLLVIGVGIGAHASAIAPTAASVARGFHHSAATLGIGGIALLLMRAFALGGGTYTGIEAVSNGVPMMRHPQVRTARRTMLLMAVSLAFTASGLLVCYLLWGLNPAPGRTMNALLVERVAAGLPLQQVLVVLFLVAEAAILVVAAQAGFADGPRVLANMALDSWVPRRFAALSERLTIANGIVLMGAAALVALVLTRGDVRHLIVMYSINVFLTFSLSLLAMTRRALAQRARPAVGSPRRRGTGTLLFVSGFALCATILVFTTIEKFTQGGWITLAVTGTTIGACLVIRRHYRSVGDRLDRAFEGLERIPDRPGEPPPSLDPRQPTAVVLVGGYSGFGVHTTLNVFRAFPGHFRGVVFASVGTIDAGAFKGEDSIDHLRQATAQMLDRYVDVARRLGIPATSRFAIGIDTVDQAEALCRGIVAEFPAATFFAGQVVFERPTWLQKFLHNQTAYALQRRLQAAGLNLVILPAKA